MTANHTLGHSEIQDMENPYAAQGPVMLDIGDDAGAILVYFPSERRGAELAYERVDGGSPPSQGHHHWTEGAHAHVHDWGGGHSHDPATPAHVAVLSRPLPSGAWQPSAVIPALPPGRYRLWLLGEVGEEHESVDVVAGDISALTWPR